MTGNSPVASTAYIGLQGQGDAATAYNTDDFHNQRSIVDLIRTGGPVQVIKAPYDKNGNPLTPGTATPIGYIDVQPLVNQVNGDGTVTQPHGTVYRVTYYRYQNGIFAVYNDPVVGDIGHMVAADRDVSSVYANNAAANPGSRRKFDLADGTYFGCSRAAAPQSYLVPQPDGGLHLVMPAGKTLAITGNLTVTGEITAGFGTGDSVTLQRHTHGGITTGTDHTAVPDAGT